MRAIQVFDGDGTKVRPKVEPPIMLHAHVFTGDKGWISVNGKRYRYAFTRAEPGDEWPNDALAIFYQGNDIAGLYSQGIGDARYTEVRAALYKNGGAKSYVAFKNLRRHELATLIMEHCTPV